MEPDRLTVPAPIRPVILAGGLASRFGGAPKGLERVGGERIIDRLRAAMCEAFGMEPLLVANQPDAADWIPGVRVVPDVRAGLGALGGLYTAVVEGPAPVVACAWDMPFVPAALLRRLAAGLDDADVVVPRSGGPRGVEPLCAAYGPACRGAIERALREQDLRAIGFHRFVRAAVLPLEEVRAFGDPSELFFNVNTADDLAAAEATWQRRG